MVKKVGISYTQPSEGFFDIHNVVYRGETGMYRLSENMTPSMNQRMLAELYETEKAKGNPVPTDANLIWAIVSAGYMQRNTSKQTSERLATFLQEGFRRFPNTLTRIRYNPSGRDEVIHNYGTSDVWSLTGKIVGPDGFISRITNRKPLRLVIGDESKAKIDKKSQWINGAPFYFWRENSTPESTLEIGVGFGAYDGKLVLDCYRVPLGDYPAFRVLRIN